MLVKAFWYIHVVTFSFLLLLYALATQLWSEEVEKVSTAMLWL